MDHTLDNLYHHRAVLFALLVKQYKDASWKSRAHYDGTMIPDMFIVGIDSPYGQITYHYTLEEWNLFQCEEIPNAPHWDGVVGGNIARLEMLAMHMQL